MALSRVETDGIKDSAITAIKIADGTVVAAEIGADAIDGTKIADDAINSEHYATGSIDTAHIANDQITGAKIADNAIDSEHYTTGSIDTAHIANDQITGDKIADDAINSEHYAAGSVDDAHLATGISASKLTGALPAISGASLTNLPAGGDTRNFIIDGDFTQWPEGTSFSAMANATYMSALMDYRRSTTVARHTGSRSTDVPTVAQSGHQSTYSLDLACTTIDASIAGSDITNFFYYMTGSDYTAIHGQQVTLNFWIKATVTGINCISFWSGAFSRNYIVEYTVNASNTWEEKSITLTLDTPTTGWTFTDATVGLTIDFIMSAGSNRFGTANVWQNNPPGDYATSNQVNNTSSTSNIFRIAQLGLYLGSSAPDAFLAESVATIQSQVGWYIERYGDAGAQRYINTAWTWSSTNARTVFHYSYKKRTQSPATSYSSGTMKFNRGSDHNLSSPTFNTKSGSRVMIYGSISGNSTHPCAGSIDISTGSYITIDSRH